MKKISVVTIQKGTEKEQTFGLGAFLMNGKEKTDVSVEKITCFFGAVRIKLSDGRVFVFKGFPYIIVKK